MDIYYIKISSNDFTTKYLKLPYDNYSYISTEGLRSQNQEHFKTSTNMS